MARPRRYDVLLLVAALLLSLVAACSGDDDPVEGGSSPSAGPPDPSDPSDPSDTSDPDAAPSEELVVIGHATRPQLRLSRRSADRLFGGEVRRWRGLDVVVGLDGPAAERAVRAVEGDPRTIAVVPSAAVGPT
uniref:hypothetical protein n=1 Tax=Nocardioides pelophilus TaxID=2172019 RepID=UPI001C80FD35